MNSIFISHLHYRKTQESNCLSKKSQFKLHHLITKLQLQPQYTNNPKEKLSSQKPTERKICYSGLERVKKRRTADDIAIVQ